MLVLSAAKIFLMLCFSNISRILEEVHKAMFIHYSGIICRNEILDGIVDIVNRHSWIRNHSFDLTMKCGEFFYIHITIVVHKMRNDVMTGSIQNGS